PHGGESLRDLLAGQILWVGYRQLLVPLGVSVLTLAALWGLRERLSQLVFYLLFAIAVTASVQLIGVYLVFATLIVPALGSRRVALPRSRLLLAYAIGVLGYAAGLVLSSALDLPSGALIVWCLVALAIAAYAATGRDAKPVAARPS
ncbi:MAG: metal ABC transporter permease, partial [Caldimonas sp.]